jgi:fructokinase
MNKRFDVSAFGEILIDFTPQSKNEQGMTLYAQNPGGAPGNVCVGISRLGGKTAFLGKVGTDQHGKFLQETLQKENVDVSGLVQDDRYFTTLAFVDVNDEGERTFSFARKPGADTQMELAELDLDTILDSAIYHIGSLSMTDEPARTATVESVKKAKENGVLISYDPNYRASLWPSEEQAVVQMKSMLPSADLVKISDEECLLITGSEDPDQALQYLLDQGARFAAITLGSNGAIGASRNAKAHAAGFKSTVADTNGAGDSFWAAVLYQIAKDHADPALLSESEIEKILTFANASAALTVRKPGAIPAMPAIEEVESLVNTRA